MSGGLEVYRTRDDREDFESKGRSQEHGINRGEVANELELRGLT